MGTCGGGGRLRDHCGPNTLLQTRPPLTTAHLLEQLRTAGCLRGTMRTASYLLGTMRTAGHRIGTAITAAHLSGIVRTAVHFLGTLENGCQSLRNRNNENACSFIMNSKNDCPLRSSYTSNTRGLMKTADHFTGNKGRPKGANFPTRGTTGGRWKQLSTHKEQREADGKSYPLTRNTGRPMGTKTPPSRRTEADDKNG